MTHLIKDIVTANSSTEFRNDVQLSSYRSNYNLELVNGYIFTRKAAPGKESSIDLLRYLCDSYMPGRNPNRFVFMATYGHGKSHFSLALANFFGKNASSPESLAVLAKIEHAANEKALYGHFESFKKNHKPFLVLIMSGTDQRDLPTQFYSSIEESLKGDGFADEIKLPFWYSGALEFLEKIPAALSDIVENYLYDQGYELSLLKERVVRHDSSTYEICHNLFMHLYSVPPSFGLVQGLKQSVDWLANNLCGTDKPYSGVLILFDEFSAFVRDYGLTMGTRPGTPLQDLLDGVENCREKVSFVALSQHDPETVADTTLKRRSAEDLQSLKIQLNRLPVAQRYQLHSSLEEVLDAYLKQDHGAWASVLEVSSFATALYDSNDITYDVFSKRYSDVLNWTGEHFQEIVTKGCYPLHPMTTALLSTVDLQETANPRSVLGFVLKSLNAISDEPVAKDGKPLWLLPTALVDYFSEMLGGDIWKDYLDAKTQAGGPDADMEEVGALKAMVLQSAAQVQTRQFGYPKIIGQFSGLTNHEATGALQNLAERGVIRNDPIKKIYTFWPAGKGANKVEEILARKINKIKALDLNLIAKTEEMLRSSSLLNPVPVTVKWGHPEDWKAENFIASRELFNRDWLVKLANKQILHRLDGADKCRGLIVWLLAESEDCVEWYRNNVSKVLKEAFGEQTVPLIVKRPRNPNPDLISLIKRSYGLTQFSNAEISDAGKEQYETVQALNMTGIKESVEVFFRDVETEVLPAYSARIKAAMPPSLEGLFKELYSMSYPLGPKSWFHQYKLSQTSLKTATKVLFGLLLDNSLDSTQTLNNNHVAKSAVELFIQPEWKVVGTDFRLFLPGKDSKIYPAWDYLDKEFDRKNGSVLLKKVFKQLLVSPYGYDITTAMILFSAWIGYFKHDVVISRSGKVVSVEDIPSDIKIFMKEVGDFSIKMNDPDELKDEASKILKEITNGGISKEQSISYIEKLKKYVERADSEDHKTVRAGVVKLTADLIITKRYDDQVDEIFKNISVHNITIENLLISLETSKNLKVGKIVQPDNDSIASTRKTIISKIRSKVETDCLKAEKITDIAQYALNLNLLDCLLSGMKKNDITDLVSLVENSIRTLNKNKIFLEGVSSDRETVGYVNGMSTSGKLKELNNSTRELLNLVVHSEGAKSLILKKINTINIEINNLLVKANNFSKQINTAKNSSVLKSIEIEILKTQPLFEGVDEIKILDRALVECQKKNLFLTHKELSEKEAKEKDASILSKIDQFSVRSQGLHSLREHLALFSHYNFLTPDGEEKAKLRLANIEEEIDTLLQFVENSTVDSTFLTNEDLATSLRTKVLEKINRFDQTDEYMKLLKIREFCDNHLSLFKEISFVKHLKFDSPDEIHEVIDNLKKLSNKYVILIGDTTNVIISRIVKRLKSTLAEKENNAIDWLNNLKNWSEKNMSIKKVLSELENPHKFLPLSSSVEIDNLKSSVIHIYESDQMIQVVEMFKGITDREKRLKCISKLNELIDDGLDL